MAAAPFLSEGQVADDSLWLRWWATGDDSFGFERGLDDKSWGIGNLHGAGSHEWTLAKHSAHLLTEEDRLSAAKSEAGSYNRRKVHERELRFRALVSHFENFFPVGSRPFASAPIHALPRRTYDSVRLDDDPFGGDIPSRLASLAIRGNSEWTALKQSLDAFGRASGLFDDFSVKLLTDIEGGPFQLQVRKFGKRGRKGPKRNLMDVGFGVSQVLPVLAALFRTDGPPMFLLQQPELHLHPSAQAALGSLFCRTAEAGRQLIVETHGDYIMNRIRLDVRDRRTNLKPEEVMLLYFERDDLDVRIHSIGFDEDGNVHYAPPNYRRFFTEELNRSLDY
jgi:hypothetical protein